MVPFVLPNVLKIAEWSSNDEYVTYVLPHLTTVMKLREPVQVVFKFLSKIKILNDPFLNHKSSNYQKLNYKKLKGITKTVFLFNFTDSLYIYEIYGNAIAKNTSRHHKIRCTALNIWFFRIRFCSSPRAVFIYNSELCLPSRLSSHEKFFASPNKKALSYY